MMTVITYVTLNVGDEPEWDAVMRERFAAAQARPGWIRGQVLIPLEAMNQRVIVGTWESRAAWEAWHADEDFAETRRRLDALKEAPDRTEWFEVILDSGAL